jgi:hypothetical protein
MANDKGNAQDRKKDPESGFFAYIYNIDIS